MNTLDLVFCDNVSTKIQHLEVEPDFSNSPVHKLVTFFTEIKKNKLKKTITYKNLSNLDAGTLVDIINEFNNEIYNYCIHSPGTEKETQLLELYG